MELQDQIMSDVISFRTYAKFLPHIQRREIYPETVNRAMNMFLDRYPNLSKDITFAFNQVHDYHSVPSMRVMQFGGEAIDKNNVRAYNCSYSPVDSVHFFGELLFLLLSGTGGGLSVQKSHTSKLPKITQPHGEMNYVIDDSIQGWAEAVDALFKAYTRRGLRPIFDFSKIRPKGSYLSTTGAKAPGPQPLKKALEKVESILKTKQDEFLSSVDCADLSCHIADCVLAGGIRRSSLIVLFDRFDSDMLKYKSGQWWEKNPQRALANVSAVLPYVDTTYEEFCGVYEACRNSGSGEPGFYWTNDINLGINPCGEVSLKPQTFCNLSSINMTGVGSKKEFLRRAKSAAIIGTLQATLTDFPYLRPEWKINTENDALIGVSQTGIADNPTFATPEILREGAGLVLDTNQKLAKKLGINPAKRVTTLKPEGSASVVLGSSSGIHDRHAEFYLRRIRTTKNDPLIAYFKKHLPDFVESSFSRDDEMIMMFPQRSPSNALIRTNTAAQQLFERILMYNANWIRPGHAEGDNFNNVSATISVKENEWDDLRELMWNYRRDYHGISLLPFDGGTYQQAPFETITEEQYNEMIVKLKPIDLRYISEEQDNTVREMSVACSGGVCELKL